MHKLSVNEIIDKIQRGLTFEAVADDYSFTVKIEDYAPYVCTAVHDGHFFRRELWDNCLHTAYERWYEEDPATKDMIRSHPIVMAGLDSRFEYDLNRDPENAIYEDAWGKQLWKKPLSERERATSLAKHRAFYRVVHALVEKVEAQHDGALVFDMHSYNWTRWERPVPTWNLGTANLDNARFGDLAESWSKKLGTMSLPNGIVSDSKINDTFEGNGYLLRYLTDNFDNTLVLATEIAKVYCDEKTGVIFPEVVRSVEDQLKELIPRQVEEFAKRNA